MARQRRRPMRARAKNKSPPPQRRLRKPSSASAEPSNARCGTAEPCHRARRYDVQRSGEPTAFTVPARAPRSARTYGARIVVAERQHQRERSARQHADDEERRRAPNAVLRWCNGHEAHACVNGAPRGIKDSTAVANPARHTGGTVHRMLILLVVAHALCATPARATPEDDDVTALDDERRADLSAQMVRFAVWGGASMAAGAAVIAAGYTTDVVELRGVGLQCAAWGLINVVTGIVGLTVPTDPERDRAALLKAEGSAAGFDLLNSGLDIGYAMAGGSLLTVGALGAFGAPISRELVGHGTGVVVQALGLFVIDLWGALGASARHDALIGRAPVAPTTQPSE